MFKKVLVAEDLDSVNFAVASVLKKLQIEKIDHAQYCDKAYILAKKAILDEEAYDLLICDLSFKQDHQNQKIGSGQELISILKELQPDLKVLVNSIEDHPKTVNTLWRSGNISAYVCKDRYGMRDLEMAIVSVSKGNSYTSPTVEAKRKQDNLFVLNDFEINLLQCISKGYTQDEIKVHFRSKNISPNSKSAIEKRLKELKEGLQARNTTHLISLVKDLNLI